MKLAETELIWALYVESTYSSVDIDIEGVADDQETTVGGLVVRNHDGNNAPRKKITLASTAASGNVTLTRNNTKVKVFTAATGGTEITFNGIDNKFAVSTCPKISMSKARRRALRCTT